MQQEHLLKESEVAHILGLSRSAVWRLEKTEPELQPVYPSVGAKRYLASRVQEYIKRVHERGW